MDKSSATESHGDSLDEHHQDSLPSGKKQRSNTNMLERICEESSNMTAVEETNSDLKDAFSQDIASPTVNNKVEAVGSPQNIKKTQDRSKVKNKGFTAVPATPNTEERGDVEGGSTKLAFGDSIEGKMGKDLLEVRTVLAKVGLDHCPVFNVNFTI